MDIFTKVATVVLGTSLLIPSVSFAAAAKCKNFDTQKAAQDYFKSRKKGWKRLDGDKDGEACECLKGGSSYNDYRCERWRKKYGKK